MPQHPIIRFPALCLVVAAALVMAAAAPGVPAREDAYPQLLALFEEWRAFEEPPRIDDGVPDYTPSTSARRIDELRRFQARLHAIDTAGWSVAQHVDHHLVRAEMNGMEYHLRVLQPLCP